MGLIREEVLCIMCMNGNILEKQINNDNAYSTWLPTGYCNSCRLLLEMCVQSMFSQKRICIAVKAAGILSAVRIQTALRQFRDTQTAPALRCIRDLWSDCPSVRVTPHVNNCWHTLTLSSAPP